MMPLRIINTKRTISLYFFIFCISIGISQEIINADNTKTKQQSQQNTTKPSKRFKADGVAAVVGEFIVLESDLNREFAQLEAQGADIEAISRCELFGKLLEDKLYAHQAIQDSVEVNELYIQSSVEQQLEGIMSQTRYTMADLIKLYKKESETALREEMYEINKNGYLANEMRKKIVEEVEITPEEVRTFFNDIPSDERPTFGTELKVAQIVIIPEVTKDAEQKVIDRLKGFKKDIQEKGASFTSKVILYSEDSGSKSTGGKYTLNRKRPRMVKEFRDVAFSLQEGEISDPFKTDFGYHIILLEKVRGQEYDVRHILLRPELTKDAIQKAKDEIKSIRQKIVDGKISFEDAAIASSDEKETKYEGGKLTNPVTQDFNFELTKMEPELYAQIQNLKDHEISEIIQDEDRVNPVKFKIITVSDRINDHEADFAKDYLKIKELALQNKQLKAISDWQESVIIDTYVKVNGEYKSCDFKGNWLKNQ